MKTLLIKSILASIFLLSAKAFAGTSNYYATTNNFWNPERGFNELISNAESFNPSIARTTYNESIGAVSIRLDRFKNGAALDSCFLTNLANSFAAARTAGVKLAVYFKYNWGPANNPGSYFCPCNNQTIQNDGQDASLSTILNHIAQLGPTLNQYNDVIYQIHAGFIGQWGEWHDSTNGNDSLTAHNQVITAERNQFPSNRHIVLRRPAYKGNYLRGLGYGLTPGLLPQLGHHNEDFADDSLMFYDPQGILSWDDCHTFYSNDISFTANGGELYPQTTFDANTALNRMQQYHYTIMSSTSLSYWQTNYPSVLATMQRSLGYRFQVTQATTPNTVSRGHAYTVSVNLVNNGFAKLMNYRAGYVVFVHGSSTYAALLTDSNGSYDLENLTLAAGIKTYTANFTLPNTFPTGTAQTTLWLPDAAANLDGNPLFSIQADGTNVNWDATAGRNILSLNNIQVQ